MEAIEERSRRLAGLLRDALRSIPRVTIHDLGPHPAAIVTFSVAGIEANVVKANLAEAGINVSASRPSSTLLDATARQLPTVVRASPHYYNTEDELEKMVGEIKKLFKLDDRVSDGLDVTNRLIQNRCVRPARIVRRNPNCGAPTPTPVPSRIS
jgi:selenocysteine lyase/cysteine desulfurase